MGWHVITLAIWTLLPSTQHHIWGYLRRGKDYNILAKCYKVYKLQHLPKSKQSASHEPNQFKITANFLDYKEGEWDVRTRSISSMLYYLSQNVEVPEKHKENELITITKTTNGGEFNWDKTPAGTMLKIRSKKWGNPDNAFVSVPYRGAWFYIADDDLNSKSTFTLLKQLFSLQAGHIRDAGPTLTLPVGGG